MADPSTSAQPGIAQLQARRQQSGRTVPPSKHSPRTSVVALAPAPSQSEADVEQKAPPEASQPAPALSPAPAGAPQPSTAPEGTSGTVTEALVRATIHFGAAQDRFLNTVAHAGRMNTPKVDASRSAVTRLAIERLEREMTAEQIVAELAKRAATTTRPGRKRL